MFLGAAVLVGNGDLDVVRSTSTDIEIGLDTKMCRSWSWITRLVRMLLILCSKTC